jgi:DNA-binding transcriptional LysR family regulator
VSFAATNLHRRRYLEISLEISADAALTDIVANRFDAGIRPCERVERDILRVARAVHQSRQIVRTTLPNGRFSIR